MIKQQCTTIKFISGGRFKDLRIKEKNFELKTDISNNRITDKLTVLKTKWESVFRLKGNEGPFTYWRHCKHQGSWRFCCWELKMLVSLHGLFCANLKKKCYIFCDFLVLPLTAQTSQSHILYFFSVKDIVHWSKKFTRQSHAKLGVFNRG